MRLLVAIFIFASCALPAPAAQKDDSKKKLCWAHAVSWGFDMDNSYGVSNAMLPFGDSPFIRPQMQCDPHKWTSAKKQIEWAKKCGIDGISVDIPILKAIPKVMERYFKAAEGSDFKIALCIDNLADPPDEIVEALSLYMERYGMHRNASYVNGRQVVFIYNPDAKSAEEWKEILGKIRDRGHNPFFLARAVFESAPAKPPHELDRLAQIYDGFYDFGASAISPDAMRARLKAQREAIDRFNSKNRAKKLLVASIAQGYNERRTAFYRPYLGTKTLRDNWEAALSADADWVSLTTWDDYGENTHFEPSQNNGDSLLALNRHYLKLWRGEECSNIRPDAIVAYKTDMPDGCDFTIDVCAFPCRVKSAFLHLKILNCSGSVLKNFDAIKFDSSKLRAKTLRIEDSAMRDWREFRIMAAIGDSSEAPPDISWREMKAVLRRPARPTAYFTYRALFSKTDTSESIRLSIAKSGRSRCAVISSDRALVGRLEILRNSKVVASAYIDQKEASAVKIPLPKNSESPCDVYQARLSYGDFRFAYSKAETLTRKSYKSRPRRTALPVIVTNSDFDENWSAWAPPLRRAPETAELRSIDERYVFSTLFEFDKMSGKSLFASSGWNISAKLGAEKIRVRRREMKAPAVELDSFKGKEKKVLVFSGNEAVSFENNSAPQGTFTVEMLLKPSKGDSPLFSDWRNYAIRLDAGGFPIFKHNETELRGNIKLASSKWHHLAAVLDGGSMRLYVNGELAGEAPCKISAKYLGSAPIFGGPNGGEERGYIGALGGISIEGAPRAPESFKLLKFLDLQK